ncbi:MAG: metal-dependent transcriptional regulator [Vulcanimicrobiaceae bacterium]
MRDRSRERAREDYVKGIYQLGRSAPVRCADLARHLDISRSSVSQFRSVLASDGFVEPSADRLDALRLTPSGIDLAIRMVRRHRVIETFLHVALAVPLASIHAEAERIEHVVSDDIVLRLARFLGNPACDPHGHRIPYDCAGDADEATSRLGEIPPGSRVRVISIDDRDADVVRELAAASILPRYRGSVERDDVAIALRSAEPPYDRVVLSARLARAVRCAVETVA